MSSVSAEEEKTPNCVEELKILVEIVSAYSLDEHETSNSKGKKFSYCPFVRCKMDGEIIHETTPALSKTSDPIWTILTDSLFIFKTTKQDLEECEGVTFEVLYKDTFQTPSTLGYIDLSAEQVLDSITGERLEFDLTKSEDMYQSKSIVDAFRKSISFDRLSKEVLNEEKDEDSLTGGTIALRFRMASSHDEDILEGVKTRAYQGRKNFVSTLNTSNFTMPPLLRSKYRKVLQEDGTYVKKYYAQPGEKILLTKDELDKKSLEPSEKWLRSGTGDLGKLYVEVIKCSKLPNMDALQNTIDKKNKTDAFVGIVFEDTMVVTDVYNDTLSPRFMPWSQRAFVLNVTHFSSPLLIGVFDHNLGIQSHSPIGRVLVNPSEFCGDTEYLVTYDLVSDPNLSKDYDKGTITIRFRTEWENEWTLMKQSLSPPPRFLVNVESQKMFNMLRFICRGEVNMEKASIKTVSARANEIISYAEVLSSMVDKMICVFLWRGTFRIKCTQKQLALMASILSNSSSSSKDVVDDKIDIKLWFPIHSIVFFLSVLKVSNDLRYLPSFIFFGLAYCLLSVLSGRTMHPNPWKRTKGLKYIAMAALQLDDNESESKKSIKAKKIDPYEGNEEAEEYELMLKLRSQRVSAYFWDFLYFGLKYKRQYMNSSAESHPIETEDKTKNFLEDHLYYIHLPLYYYCVMLRSLRNLVLWKVPLYTLSFTVLLISIGIMFLFIDWITLTQRMLKLFLFMFCGPWMHFFDRYFFQKYYKTEDELRATKTYYEPRLEDLFETERFRSLRKMVLVAFEDAVKLKAMRHYIFGKFSEVIPSSDMQQYPDIPLPVSSAKPVQEKSPKTTDKGTQELDISGQHLRGSMIPMFE